MKPICFKKILSSLLLFYPLCLLAYPASYYADQSILSSGHWIKISVSQTGIHQLSYDTLREFGFDDPSSVSVYGYGGASLTSNVFSADAPDDLKPTAIMHTPDGRLLFYGEADLSISASSISQISVRRNLYDTKGYYFLTDAYPRLDANQQPTADSDFGSAPITNHLSISFIEHETQNPSDGGAIFHDSPLIPGEIRNYDFEITDFEPNDEYPYGRFFYSFAANGSQNTNLELFYPEGLTIQSFSDGKAPLQSQENKYYSTSYGLARISDVADNGTYSIGFSIGDGCSPDYAAIDKAYIIYPRRNIMPDNGSTSIIMNFPDAQSYDCVSIGNSSPSVCVWDISDASMVTPCLVDFDPQTSVSKVSIPEIAGTTLFGHMMIAFDSSASYPEPTYAGAVGNQNLHGISVPDMVIITTDELLPAAERLADLHRDHDNMDVAVVTQQSIFNEFSSGSRSAMAYKRFLKMLYDRNPDKIHYLLLYGNGSWDNRRTSGIEHLICYETEVIEQARDMTKNYTSDKYFVMLGDRINENRLPFEKMDLAVGRLDISSISEGDKANAKIERFLKRTRSHSVYGNILVLSDDGDKQRHFLDAEETANGMDSINSFLTFTKAHNLIYPWANLVSVEGRKAISAALKIGQGFMLYYGHSKFDALTGERLYDLSLISQSHCNDYPFAMIASCETFGFDRYYNALAQAMINEDHGGAIGIIGSSRSVYMEYNKSFAKAVSYAYANANPQTSIGDIVRDAHNYCITNYSETDRAVNSMCYNLCGDPALKLGAPGLKAVINKIDGHSLSNENVATLSLTPLKPFTIEGYIADADGNAVDFDGEAVIRLFDTPVTVKTFEKTGSDKNRKPVTLDERLLANKVVKIENGKFYANITSPVPANGDGCNRIIISAVSADGTQSAAGKTLCCKVSDTPLEGTADMTPPEITDMYIDNPSFSNGDITPASFNVYASISVPTCGINLSQAIGYAPRFSLDGNKSFNLAANSVSINTDGTASFFMPVEDIADGRHELTLTVRSNSGVSASRTIDFIVKTDAASASLSIDRKIARESAIISLSHNFNGEPVGHLIIEDSNGNTVFSSDNCSLPFEWKLTDNDSKNVPDGRYRAYALLHDDINYAATKKIDIVVIR